MPYDPDPQNIILYGPPGTGKTYATRQRAVELIEGQPWVGDRTTLRKRYDGLVESGQIAFVTFHQSYGYEDFVEGLRPETEGQEAEGATSADHTGFRLVARPGVFATIAAVARQAYDAVGSKPPGRQTTPNSNTRTQFSLGDRRVFKMSLGRAGIEDEIYENAIAAGETALGYGGDIDWSDAKYRNYDEVAARWRQQPGEEEAHGNRGDIAQLWRLREMNEGDVIVVSEGNRAFRAVGIVSGDYRYEPDDADGYLHRRDVDWRVVLDRSLPYSEICTHRFKQTSCYQLPDRKLKRAALERLLSQSTTSADPSQDGNNPSAASADEPNEAGSAPPPDAAVRPNQFVIIIDEINRANISKVFGELITLIEPDKRLGMAEAIEVTLPYSGDTFGVPANLHILGTMNTADRSIALLDTALRRRFTFEEMMPDPSHLRTIDGINLRTLLTTVNERVEYLLDRDRQIGHAFFIGCRTKADVDAVMATKVIPLLCEYFFEDFARVAAILGQGSSSPHGFFHRHALASPLAHITEPRIRWTVKDRSQFDHETYAQALAGTAVHRSEGVDTDDPSDDQDAVDG